jgi:hypothetical protein
MISSKRRNTFLESRKVDANELNVRNSYNLNKYMTSEVLNVDPYAIEPIENDW